MGLTNLSVKTVLAGNGSNQVFAIPFDIIISDSAEVAVYIRDESVDPATETLQTISTHYTLTGGVGGGFNTDVTFVTAPLSTDKVLLKRILPKTQTLDLSTSTDSQPESTEKQLDRITAQIQELGEEGKRSLKLTASHNVNPADVEPVANQYLAFDSGKNLVLAPLVSVGVALASQSEAEAGTDNIDYMSPLRVQQKVTLERTATATLAAKTLTSPVLNTGVSGTAVKDEDNMVSDSATHLATQQSIKAYVDSVGGGGGATKYIQGASNTSNTLTAAVTPCTWTETVDADNLWNGSEFVADADMLVRIDGRVFYTGNSSTQFFAYVDGVQGIVLCNDVSDNNKKIGGVVKLLNGETLTMRVNIGVTLSADTKQHWICINQIA